MRSLLAHGRSDVEIQRVGSMWEEGEGGWSRERMKWPLTR